MMNRAIQGLALIAGLAIAGQGLAAQQPLDDRFYIAPLVSYGFFDEDTFEPDDQVGGQFSFGKTLTRHLALELYGFHYNDVDLDRRGGGSADLDITGYGLSALLFPARNLLPVFAVVGIGEGEHDFDGLGGGFDDRDADFVDFGLGFLAPINDYGVAIRGEYRHRTSDVDAGNGGAPRSNSQHRRGSGGSRSCSAAKSPSRNLQTQSGAGLGLRKRFDRLGSSAGLARLGTPRMPR